MYYKLDWNITIGRYRLAMLDNVEIHKSADLLAATAVIKLPGAVYNKALKVDGKIKRGDAVVVKLGYAEPLQEEFRGYLLNISTDDGSITLNCEDDLFLLRKSIPDKEFLKTTVQDIAQYLIDETGTNITVDCSLTIDYDKFVIHQATAYDVLKKLKEETKGEIYLSDGVLNIHPPMLHKTGDVSYSFQVNIEKSDLKYKRKEDKQLQVIVENVGADGQKKTTVSGTTGGDKITIQGNGLSDRAMKILADNEYSRQMYDGYEGGITGWLIPFCAVGYSAKIKDEDYEYKDGAYYVSAVTTSMGSGGGVRRVEMGRRLN